METRVKNESQERKYMKKSVRVVTRYIILEVSFLEMSVLQNICMHSTHVVVNVVWDFYI